MHTHTQAEHIYKPPPDIGGTATVCWCTTDSVRCSAYVTKSTRIIKHLEESHIESLSERECRRCEAHLANAKLCHRNRDEFVFVLYILLVGARQPSLSSIFSHGSADKRLATGAVSLCHVIRILRILYRLYTICMQTVLLPRPWWAAVHQNQRYSSFIVARCVWCMADVCEKHRCVGAVEGDADCTVYRAVK